MRQHTERPAWNLVTGTLTTYVLLFVNIGIGIFLMPFTMRHLGQADYGLWMLVASLTAYFQLLDLGYGNGLVRQVTQADAKDDEQAVNAVLSTFAVVYSVIGLVTLAATAVLALAVLPRFPNLSPGQLSTGQWVLAILGARIAIGFPMGIFGAVTTARQRFALTGTIAIGVALLQGAATYVVLSTGHGLIALVGATAAISVASYAVYAAAALRTFPGLRLSLSRFSGQQVREVTAFSIYLFLISIAIHVATSIDNLVIGAHLGMASIAVYTVAVRLAEYQRNLCGQFAGLLFPLVVRFHASGDAGALRATLLDGTRIGLALAAGVAMGLIVFGRELVQLWMGPGFEGSIVPLYVLAIAAVVIVAQGPTGTILLGTGRHRLVAWASLAEIVLNVGLSLALVGRWGLTGVAVGTAVPYAVLNLLVLMPIACRSVGVPIPAFIRTTGLPTLIAVVPAMLTAGAVRTGGVAVSLPALLLQASLVGIAYILAFWLIGLRSVDRARYIASIRQVATDIPATPRVVTP